MKRKLLIIFGVIFLALFVVYNVGIDIGNVHLGKQHDEIGKNNNFKFKSSPFYKNYLKSDSLVVLNLWATWCKPCLEEIPEFQMQAIKHQNVKFAFLSIDNDEGKLKDYLSKNKLKDITFENADYRWGIRNFLDGRKENSLVKVDAVPITYFIKNGKVLKKIEGSVAREELISNINTLK